MTQWWLFQSDDKYALCLISPAPDLGGREDAFPNMKRNRKEEKGQKKVVEPDAILLPCAQKKTIAWGSTNVYLNLSMAKIS